MELVPYGSGSCMFRMPCRAIAQVHRFGRLEEDIRKGSVRALGRDLPHQTQQLLRGIGTLPVPRFTSEMVQTILGCDANTAGKLLQSLLCRELVLQTAGDRYVVPEPAHGEMRAWAAEWESERGATVLRLAEQHYLPRLLEADWRIDPFAVRYNDCDFQAGRRGTLPDAAASLRWFVAERALLRDLIVDVAEAGHDALVCRMVEALWGGLVESRAYPMFQPVLRRAIGAAQRARNPAQSLFHVRLSLSLCATGDAIEAKRVAVAGRAVATFAEDQRSVSLAACAQGQAHLALGEFGSAISAHERALRISRRVGDEHSIAMQLQHLAEAQVAGGWPRAAAESLSKAIASLKPRSDIAALARARCVLAEVLRTDQRPNEALHVAQTAIDELELTDLSGGVSLADALVRAGRAARDINRTEKARSAFEKAAQLYEAVEDRTNYDAARQDAESLP